MSVTNDQYPSKCSFLLNGDILVSFFLLQSEGFIFNILSILYTSKYKIKKNQYFEYEEHNLNEKCWQEGFITYDCKYEGNI